jgi:uncharacterized Zn finger protein
MAWYDDRPYVSAAQRRVRARREIGRRAKKGLIAEPVALDGRTITKTFWGKAWCDHLEHCGDYANRLPRGRTYVRNGSVLHLGIGPRRIDALVQGSELYEVTIDIEALAKPRWTRLVGACAGQISSLVELLQGKLSAGVMAVVTSPDRGLFPAPRQIEMRCSCPDSAIMCKHVAAVLYGVGSRLDTRPELLFLLRGVDHAELLDGAVSKRRPAAPDGRGARMASAELSDVFGIEIDAGPRPSRGRRT